LVSGEVQPAEATWTDHLKKIDGEPRTIVADPADPAGRNAVLHYRIAQRLSNKTLLEITLETGRTHQIRVQCASRGHPLLGDELYGSREPFGPWRDDERERLIALHARTLKFWRHELRGYISVVAPLPAYWRDADVDDAAVIPLQS
jgi:23S rRNA-/tRNA-specific pseudouridylate synthase